MLPFLDLEEDFFRFIFTNFSDLCKFNFGMEYSKIFMITEFNTIPLHSSKLLIPDYNLSISIGIRLF